MAETKELYWAAGLFEGEGCIFLNQGGARVRKYGYKRASLSLGMTDEDSVQGFAKAVGVGNVRGPFLRTTPTPNAKPVWEWRISRFEEVQAVIAMLWGGLGARRKARAAECLQADTRRPGQRRVFDSVAA